MSINDNYKDEHGFLKATDVGNKRIKAVIRSSEWLDDAFKPGQKKLVLYFVDKEKSLILNQTNAFKLSELFGDDETEWYGKGIILSTEDSGFEGKLGIVVDTAEPKTDEDVPF